MVGVYLARGVYVSMVGYILAEWILFCYGGVYVSMVGYMLASGVYVSMVGYILVWWGYI